MAAFLILIMAIAVLHGTGASQPFEDMSEYRATEKANEEYRLGKNAIPSSYKLKISPNFEDFTFTGEVEIDITLVNATSTVQMHSKFLNIIDAKEGANNLKYVFDEKHDFVTFNSTDQIAAGPKKILIKFSGKLQDDMYGFYRSYYVQNGTIQWMATTQFQPVHARKAFPCFDEPSFKAKFNIIIECPQNYTCASNMPRKLPATGNTYEFQETPRMSTYLIAFIVSKFEVAADLHLPERKAQILARPDAKNMGQYAAITADKLVDYMNVYFKFNYSAMGTNMKLDHVAIPDFSAGAMENWGLVTYREAYLMYQPEEMTVPYKQRIATILSHEIAHMWFGNYVTCHWWSDTWLNEAFARFFEYFATEEVENYKLENQFTTAQMHTSMLVDTSKTSVPMSNPDTNSPAEISVQFGTITYNKGASILRMIENYMGKNKFQAGLQRHLNSSSFDAVTPDDLFTALDAEVNLTATDNIKAVMSSWTTQAGFPLLTVNVARPSGVISLSQKRFGRENEADTKLYKIPLTYKTEAENSETSVVVKRVMSLRNDSITIQNLAGYVLFNLQQMGFYRVNYDDVTWHFIIAALNTAKQADIHEYNRAQIVDDAFNLAREGNINYTRMFDIIHYLDREIVYAPWTAAFAGFSYLRMHLGKNATVAKKLDSYILNKMTPVVNALGFEDRGENLEKTFRRNVLSYACNLGHEGCISSSKTKFNQLRSGTRVPADLREHVYCNGIRHGSSSDFEYLLNKHDNENVVGEQLLILGQLGCTKDPININRYLARTLDLYTGIRDQDRMTAFNSALNGNRENIDVVLDFVIDNAGRFKATYGSSRLSTVFSNILTRSNSTQITKFEAFLNRTVVLTDEEKTSGRVSIQNAKDINDWAQKNSHEVLTWLNKNGSGTVVASFALLLSMLVTIFFRN